MPTTTRHKFVHLHGPHRRCIIITILYHDTVHTTYVSKGACLCGPVLSFFKSKAMFTSTDDFKELVVKQLKQLRPFTAPDTLTDLYHINNTVHMTCVSKGACQCGPAKRCTHNVFEHLWRQAMHLGRRKSQDRTHNRQLCHMSCARP